MKQYIAAVLFLSFFTVVVRADFADPSQPTSDPAALAAAAASPDTCPATNPTTSPGSDFAKAIDPSTDVWTTAMPDDVPSILGYRSVPVRQRFVHNTYPADRSLPGAKTYGSAGTTTLNRAQYIDFGFRWQTPLDDHWSYHFDATGLFAVTGGSNTNASGFNLVDQRSLNDDRYRGKADFIYTDSDFGYDLAAGLTYSISKQFYIGGVADFTTLYIDNGWDRYSSFVTQSSRQYLVPAGGITLGYRDTKGSSIEATVLFGRNGVGYFFGAVWNF